MRDRRTGAELHVAMSEFHIAIFVIFPYRNWGRGRGFSVCIACLV